MSKIRNATPRKGIYSGVAGFLGRVVDKTIAIVAPGLTHRMQQARMKSAALLSYEAAKITRTNPSVAGGSADSEILPDLEAIRNASRAMVRDDAHVASAIMVLEQNIVGTGIRPQATCTPEATGMSPEDCDAWRAACEAEFARWAEDEADATRRGTFYDLQRLVCRSRVTDGEAIAHAVVGGDGLVACELIDPDRLLSPGFFDTDKIRGGVELGPHGEPVAYHILPAHPDDRYLGANFAQVPARIAANDSSGLSIVQHFYRRDRPGQTRGVPVIAAAIPFSRHLHHYLDSELIAARGASNFALFIKKAASATDADIFPVQGSESDSGQVESYHENIEPGTIEYLNEGEEPVPYSPNRPGAQFDSFVTRILRAITASMGLAYELVVRDFGSLNYINGRAMLMECRRGFDQERATLVRQFCRPWYHNVIRAAIGAGRLKPPARWLDNPTPFLAVRWVAPAYGWVDPKKDIESSAAAVAANLSTPYDEAARGGMDAEQILRERTRFLVKAKELEEANDLQPGVLTNPVPSGASAPAVQGSPPSPTADSGDEDEADAPPSTTPAKGNR